MIARSLPTNEIQGIREMFKAIDEDGSGCITVNELREGLRKKGAELAFAEVCANMHGRGGRTPDRERAQRSRKPNAATGTFLSTWLPDVIGVNVL